MSIYNLPHIIKFIAARYFLKSSNVGLNHFSIVFTTNNIKHSVIGSNYTRPQAPYYVHAEHDMINKMRKLMPYKKYLNNKIQNTPIDILIIRISKIGKLGQSRPCFDCLVKLQAGIRYGIHINNVYYTDTYGNIIKEKLNDMIPAANTKYYK